MTKWTRTRTVAKTSLATSLAVVAAGASGIGIAAATYFFEGSDTLTDVVRDSITGAGLTATFDYKNTGSGQGETDALAGTQSIVPMSRNWKSSVMTAHPTWAPALRNVIGLDAAVMVNALNGPTGYRSCKNVSITLEADRKHAVAGNILQLVLGGVDGAGSDAACRDQRRLDAIDQLTACFGGVDYLEHVYRRDDRSGTADTFKERLRVQRFCNGRSPGVDATGADYNLNNDDADPVRRACIPADSTHAKTVCTLWPATTHCEDTPSAAGCTQGFLVALSQNDPGASTDITTSIANRVLNDPNRRIVGFAGRAASKVNGNTPSMITSVSPSDLSVRNANYFLSRRLFMNWADTNLIPGSAHPDATRLAAETSLYNWMTDPNGDPLPGRYNVDPILVAHGFLPCTTDHTDPTDTTNLCNSEWPVPPVESTPKQCIPPGKTGNGADICCSTGNTSPASPGTCPDYTCVAATQACNTTADCCAASPALSCQDLGVGHLACCVGPNEKGQPCSVNADCCGNSCGVTTAGICD